MSNANTIDLGDSSAADYQRYEFFRKLAADHRGPNALILGQFESGFLAGWMSAGDQMHWFTPKRRAVVDRMWARHGGELKYPHPNDVVAERPSLPDADPTGCQFIVKDEDKKQRRCNDPAKFREPRQGSRPGLRYCQAHGEHVQRFCKGIVLVPISAEESKAPSSPEKLLEKWPVVASPQ